MTLPLDETREEAHDDPMTSTHTFTETLSSTTLATFTQIHGEDVAPFNGPVWVVAETTEVGDRYVMYIGEVNMREDWDLAPIMDAAMGWAGLL